MPPSRNRLPPDPFDLAVRLLRLRPHSELELRRKLRRKGCATEAIEDAVARARRLGYLDDATFARALVAHRSRTRGPSVVAAELAAKGINRGLARDALGVVDHSSQVEAARRLAARSSDTDRQVVAARLLRRGFTTDVIREALDLELDPGC